MSKKSMMFMLDTNTFDFIYDNDLIFKLNTLVKNNKIMLCSTHVQIDEIKKIPNIVKREKIGTILHKSVIASVGFSATDESTNRGYVGARSDSFIAIGSEDEEIIKKVNRTLTATHPLGNSADITIAFTAMKENMDYLVSDDAGIHKVSKILGSNVKNIVNSEFQNIIEELILN